MSRACSLADRTTELRLLGHPRCSAVWIRAACGLVQFWVQISTASLAAMKFAPPPPIELLCTLFDPPSEGSSQWFVYNNGFVALGDFAVSPIGGSWGFAGRGRFLQLAKGTSWRRNLPRFGKSQEIPTEETATSPRSATRSTEMAWKFGTWLTATIWGGYKFGFKVPCDYKELESGYK